MEAKIHRFTHVPKEHTRKVVLAVVREPRNYRFDNIFMLKFKLGEVREGRLHFLFSFFYYTIILMF